MFGWCLVTAGPNGSVQTEEGWSGERFTRVRERTITVSYLRRKLSSCVMKANISCLLERLVQVGENLGQPGKRRRWARIEEEKARCDRESRWLARTTGHNLLRRGQFLLH